MPPEINPRYLVVSPILKKAGSLKGRRLTTLHNLSRSNVCTRSHVTKTLNPMHTQRTPCLYLNLLIRASIRFLLSPVFLFCFLFRLFRLFLILNFEFVSDFRSLGFRTWALIGHWTLASPAVASQRQSTKGCIVAKAGSLGFITVSIFFRT
jgi:hypothetical protein